MAAVESSFKHHFLRQKEIQIRKFSVLKDHHQITKTPKPIHVKIESSLRNVVFLNIEQDDILDKGRDDG
jgi:hypothetical protein